MRRVSWTLVLLAGGYFLVSPAIKIMQIDVAEAGESDSKQTEPSTVTLRGKRAHFVAEWKDTSASEQGDQPVLALEFSPDGKLVVTASADGVLRLWDVEHGQPIRKLLGHEGEVRAVRFSPDGTHVVSGGMDGTVRLWEVNSGKTLWSVEGHKLEDPNLRDQKVMVDAVGFSPEGKYVISGGWDGTMRIWDTADGKEIGPPMKQETFVLSIAISPDGASLLSGSGMPDPEAGFGTGELKLWDIKSGKEIWSVVASEHGINSVRVHGTQAVTGGGDGFVKLWDLATGKELRLLKGHEQPVTAAVFSPDGTLVLSAALFEKVRLWNVMTGNEIDQINLPGNAPPAAIGFAPDGLRFLIGTETGNIFVFGLSEGT